MKLHRVAPMAAIMLATTMTLAACGDDDPTGSDTPANDDSAEAGSETGDDSQMEGGALSGQLQAAGASSQTSAMQAWIADYQGVQPDVTVTYDSIGSGGGRENFLAGATSLAGSDAYLDEDEQAAAVEVCGDGGAMNLPVYISPVAVPYNLPGVDDLKLAPDTLAMIFDQQITSWDDPIIAEANPDADLPDLGITAVNRSDESGTTENFLEYLSAAAPDSWSYEADAAWPVSGGEQAAQTSGVIQVVNATEGAIGYADASQVTGQAAQIGVGDEFVAFSEEAAARVVDASEPADTGVEGDLALDLARDTTESGAYPIVLVSYHIVCSNYEDAETADMVKDFVGFVISEDGQAAANAAAGSAPISDDLRGRATESLDMITSGN